MTLRHSSARILGFFHPTRYLARKTPLTKACWTVGAVTTRDTRCFCEHCGCYLLQSDGTSLAGHPRITLVRGETGTREAGSLDL